MWVCIGLSNQCPSGGLWGISSLVLVLFTPWWILTRGGRSERGLGGVPGGAGGALGSADLLSRGVGVLSVARV